MDDTKLRLLLSKFCPNLPAPDLFLTRIEEAFFSLLLKRKLHFISNFSCFFIKSIWMFFCFHACDIK